MISYKKLMKRTYKLLMVIGFDARKFLYSIKGSILYIKGFYKYYNQHKNSKIKFNKLKLFPILDDWFEVAGTAKGHYFHQDLIVAQQIYSANPKVHIDVGSRIDGFVAHVASFRTIKIIDIRPLERSQHPNIEFLQHDLMRDTGIDPVDSVSW